MTETKKYNLTLFDYFLIVGVVSCTFAYAVLSGEWDVLGIIAGIAGIINVVLCAKGNIINYVFGFINTSLYAYISFKSQLYGDFALNALYYVPMQFVGWYNWRKRISPQNSVQVIGRRLSWRARAIWGSVTLLATAASAVILAKVGDPYPVKDSITTVVSIIAMALMVKSYMEQWVLWLLVNIVSVIIWLQFTIAQEPHSAPMLIMWLFFTANSYNGFITWLKISR
ncbi:MAG: nicotinamide mononucleotide transporter [Bacteroidales bacterium]|nr:nicotinamide mononucleotide transporter [Bacteroidales bacterium]